MNYPVRTDICLINTADDGNLDEVQEWAANVTTLTIAKATTQTIAPLAAIEMPRLNRLEIKFSKVDDDWLSSLAEAIW